MKKIALLILLLSTAAYAEDEKPQSAPAEVQAPAPTAPKLFYLELDQSDINSLSVAINELPKRIADGLILKINGQLQVQAKIAEGYAAATDAKKKAKK